jgi:hypothetical protein
VIPAQPVIRDAGAGWAIPVPKEAVGVIYAERAVES